MSTGYSNGGSFTNLLGCLRGDVLAAIAPVAGSGPLLDTTCQQTIAALVQHDERDKLIPFQVGATSFAHWAHNNRCQEAPAKVPRGCAEATGCEKPTSLLRHRLRTPQLARRYHRANRGLLPAAATLGSPRCAGRARSSTTRTRASGGADADRRRPASPVRPRASPPSAGSGTCRIGSRLRVKSQSWDDVRSAMPSWVSQPWPVRVSSGTRCPSSRRNARPAMFDLSIRLNISSRSKPPTPMPAAPSAVMVPLARAGDGFDRIAEVVDDAVLERDGPELGIDVGVALDATAVDRALDGEGVGGVVEDEGQLGRRSSRPRT